MGTATDGALEVKGPDGHEEDGGVWRDHLSAYIDDKGLIQMHVDFYHPDPPEAWNEDDWEARSCYISGKADRANWRAIYRIGRALARHGRTKINIPGCDPIEACCDGTIIAFEEK